MSSYLGQNFLHDSKIQQYIADRVALLYRQAASTALIEIGPGKGAITKRIVQISPVFFAIEKDTTMQAYLSKMLTAEQLIFADILEVEMDALAKDKDIDPEQTFVVGNLPYYITSPILRKFFGDKGVHCAGGFFMIQKEVGEKIHSQANKKSYLRRLLNHSYDISYTKTIPAKAFRPAPRVHSCLISLTRKATPWPIDFTVLIDFLDVFAPYSRKTLGKIQKMTETTISIPDHLAKKRLEDCSIQDILAILEH